MLDDEDVALLRGKLFIGKNGYVFSGHWMVHHLVMGGAREGFHIDHDNGNKLDCRKSNLKFVTPQANQINRKQLNTNNTSGVRGVTWSKRKRKWVAQIMVDRKGKFLGEFHDLEEAIAARRAGELKYWGVLAP